MSDKPMPLTAEEEKEMRGDYADTIGRIARLLATIDAERAARVAAEAKLPVAMKIGTEDMEALTADRDRLARENADLRAVVERLPKTADGVPVTPGQLIWPRSDIMQPEDEEGTAVKCRWYICDPLGGELIEDDELDLSKCYSTRAAAEAARTEARNAKTE